MSYSVIICEDDLVQLEQFEVLVKNYMLFHSELFDIALKTQFPDEVLSFLNDQPTNGGIYFLDIDLHSKMNGIDLASEIRRIDVQAKIIFVTTHDEMAPLTFKRKVEALDFIVKDQPIEDFRQNIYDTLTLAKTRIDKTMTRQKKCFSFTVGNQIYRVSLDDVCIVETSTIPHRLNLYTHTGLYEFYGNLNELEKKYPSLFRANRSCLINPESISEANFSKRKITFDKGLVRTFSIGKAKKLKSLM
ncbi:response regulator transcription factor [Companilactobacillus allii]|uniref:DNA-binding response regulator n=1 Tax=Companilactobacillus allii TaxID=1847728 RepID=A0A1P8Q1D9_9LACO|nr:response regulator transcription factor [Companilactobacillus allii]APX71646.1 DNA-binding response regulator [Companilactobacillus allii]USQ68729.1 response regulator transcription factor [Companilactobacillus allii]